MKTAKRTKNTGFFTCPKCKYIQQQDIKERLDKINITTCVCCGKKVRVED